jgi:hypothetical protein
MLTLSLATEAVLTTPSQNLVQVFEVVENLFREFIQKQTSVVKSIPCENLCNDALDFPLLKSQLENIMQDCSQETSKQTKKICQENIVKLYLRCSKLLMCERLYQVG